MLVFVRDTFNGATDDSGGGQKRSAPGASAAAAAPKRPALGLAAAPAPAARQARSLAEILEEVKNMPPLTNKPVSVVCTPQHRHRNATSTGLLARSLARSLAPTG